MLVLHSVLAKPKAVIALCIAYEVELIFPSIQQCRLKVIAERVQTTYKNEGFGLSKYANNYFNKRKTKLLTIIKLRAGCRLCLGG